MSAAALPLRREQRTCAGHFHLPSIHIRDEHGNGYDYEEGYFAHVKRGGGKRYERVVTLAFVENGQAALVRKTRDELCGHDMREFEADLPVLMEEGNPEVEELMQERGRAEFERQARIAAGIEQACAKCGCSMTRACSGGCVWATGALCSRCVR